MNKECGICHRLKPKEVYEMVKEISDYNKLNYVEFKKLFESVIDLIQYEDSLKNGSLWCGKSKKTIVGSIVYIMGFCLKISYSYSSDYMSYHYTTKGLTQNKIAIPLNINIVLIRNLYQKILKKHRKYLEDKYNYNFKVF